MRICPLSQFLRKICRRIPDLPFNPAPCKACVEYGSTPVSKWRFIVQITLHHEDHHYTTIYHGD